MRSGMAEDDPRYFMPFQYANEANARAHYEGTGAEIAEELDRVDVLVAGLGTGGTLMGAGARVREAFPGRRRRGCRAAPGRPGDRPALARGRLRSADPRRAQARPQAAGHERRVRRRSAGAAGARGDLRGRVLRRRRARRPQARGRARRRASSSACSRTAAGSTCRRRSGPRRTWSRRWRIPSGGDPDRGPPGAGAARARRGAERGVRPARVPRRRRRALPARRERAREPVPLPAEAGRPGRLLPRGRGLPARRLPLASDGQRAAVAHGPREHRAVGRAAVLHPRPADRRAARLADRGGRGGELELAE